MEVAIDGSQIQTSGTVHFELGQYLRAAGWTNTAPSDSWQGTYYRAAVPGQIRIHSNPGKGDVVTRLASGKILRAECKKGPLHRTKGSREYALLREALGQLLTVNEVEQLDLLAVAVPASEKFAELAARWRTAPLVKRLGIRILLVSRTGGVDGFVGTQ
ncbi:MAG: hypothetical protein AB7O37_05170 [Vicinamibacteria bacterium]